VAIRPQHYCLLFSGSSSGIGQTAALSFADEGASVLIHGQNKERLDVRGKSFNVAFRGYYLCTGTFLEIFKLQKTEKLLLGEGVPPNRICKVVGSMEDPKTAEMIIAECLRKFARIDVLVGPFQLYRI
jgi:NAD(P)-dependent dehydrogenase (short-subunit alcohol dehydrogenase family)